MLLCCGCCTACTAHAVLPSRDATVGAAAVSARLACLQVDRRGNGTAMFASSQDMDDAVKMLDNTEMKNMRGTCILRVDYMDRAGGGGGGRDRSPPPRDRSPPPRRDSRCGPLRLRHYHTCARLRLGLAGRFVFVYPCLIMCSCTSMRPLCSSHLQWPLKMCHDV